MSLPLLYLVPQTPDDWSAWGFNHAALHYDVVSAITQQKSKNLTQFCLNPLDPDDLGMWLYQHQTMHNQANQALGTQGFNLLDYDLADPDSLSEFLNLNAVEHQNWSRVLKVT